MTTYETANEEIQSGFDFIKAALSCNKIYDSTIGYAKIRQIQLDNVKAAIVQLSHAEKILSKPGVEKSLAAELNKKP